MIKVYEFNCAALGLPVTIFARNVSQAHEMFELWHSYHTPFLPITLTTISESSLRHLTDTPQLAEAARAGITGVGYWMGHREGWCIRPADGDTPGVIAPLLPTVRYFVGVSDEIGEVLVFAECRHDADKIYDEYHRDCMGWSDDAQDLTEMSRWLLTDAKVTLREDMEAGLTGIGRECEDGFWHILPPDYEAPLTDAELDPD